MAELSSLPIGSLIVPQEIVFLYHLMEIDGRGSDSEILIVAITGSGATLGCYKALLKIVGYMPCGGGYIIVDGVSSSDPIENNKIQGQQFAIPREIWKYFAIKQE